MNNNSKILVAGARGLVGSAIIRTLRSKGYPDIIESDIDTVDFRKQSDTEQFFNDIRPEIVFLAAAKVGGIYANNTYKAEFIYDNLMIAANVVNSAKLFGVKKLLNLGSSCIYPKFAPQPLKEEYLLNGELEPTNEPYAIAKIAAIKLCRYYNEQYGTDFISVMPTNLYGSNDNFNLETSHVLPALIRKMLLAKWLREENTQQILKDISKYRLGFGLDQKITQNPDSLRDNLGEIGISSKSIQIWGTGNVRREFLHVNDMASACVYLMETYSAKEVGEFINIGTGEDTTIRELVYLIKELSGFDGEIIFDSTKPEGTPRKQLDVSRLRSLGWEAKISLREGIQSMINEYISDH
jgi:GDP-L-fucose synthase